MTGVFGGTVTGAALDRLAVLLSRRSRYGRFQFEEGELGLGLVHHGDDHPGHESIEGDGFRGFVYGAIGNLDEFGHDMSVVIERILTDPPGTLAALDGPFLLTALDTVADRLIVATDKLASRPLYYRARDGLVIGSELKTVVAMMDEIEVDERAVADLLLMGYVWGEKTLVSGVRRLPPATYLDYEDGHVQTTRYWKPNFEPANPTLSYMGKLVDTYEQATASMSTTLDGSVGLWLSGGLDSRALAASLSNVERPHISLTGYTYNSNPPDGDNPALANRTGEAKGFPVEEVPVPDDDLETTIDEIVSVTDGMIQWTNALNVAAISAVESSPTIMLDACGQGELLGEQIWRAHLTLAQSPIESMRQTESQVDPAIVGEVLAGTVDPEGSFKRAVTRSDETRLVPTVMDAHFQNHYAGNHFVSNQLTRAYTDTRTPLPHGSFLSHVARLPIDFHLRGVPFPGGNVPYATTRPKLELIQALDPSLAAIPYERSNLMPTYPMAFHTGSYVVSRGVRALRERLGGDTNDVGARYRSDDAFREFLNDLLEGAKKRHFFDADAITDVQHEHLAEGKDRMNVLAPITTIERWLQQYVGSAGSKKTGEYVLA